MRLDQDGRRIGEAKLTNICSYIVPSGNGIWGIATKIHDLWVGGQLATGLETLQCAEASCKHFVKPLSDFSKKEIQFELSLLKRDLRSVLGSCQAYSSIGKLSELIRNREIMLRISRQLYVNWYWEKRFVVNNHNQQIMEEFDELPPLFKSKANMNAKIVMMGLGSYVL